MCKGMLMMYLNTYNFIKTLAIIALVTINYEYWGAGFFEVLVMSAPYFVIYALANESRYQSRLSCLSCLLRASAGIIVFLLALGLLFGVTSDPQAGIGVIFAIVIQYGVIFASEAFIALFTYREDCT
jgi:hypothetical protein